jgi:hypothetical protein
MQLGNQGRICRYFVDLRGPHAPHKHGGVLRSVCSPMGMSVCRSNKSRTLTRRPLWIIASYQHNQMNALTVDAHGEGGLSSVFSFEEEAETFL